MTRAIIVLTVLVCGIGQIEGAVITGVSIPVNSQNDVCHPVVDDVWSVGTPPYPLNVDLGIGNIINPGSFVPMVAEEFIFHDHDNLAGQPPVMLAPHIPDPERAVVTYTFNEPTVVDQLEILQHTNGITNVEGFVGDSIDSLISIDSIFGPAGDATGQFYFVETQSYVFDFDNSTAGSIFQFVIRKTSFSEGYAAYRAFPRNADGVRYSAATVPEPTTFCMLLMGVIVSLLFRRRK